MTKHKRQVNFELLRIVAMLMIITLHYLDKGGILPTWIQEVERPLGGLASGPELMAMFLEAFCLPAVNVFVLLTGYFSCHNTRSFTSFRRIGGLWFTVIFYSAAIALLALASGLTAADDISVYFVTETLFPVLTNRYWFATSYLLLMLFAPFLRRGMEQLSGKEYGILLAALLGYFSLAKTIVFFYRFPLDSGGYDVLWFMVLYLLGGYIARFGLPFAETAGKAAALYAVPASMIPLLTLALRYVNLLTGRFGEVTEYAYTYNHVLCLLSSVGLFSLFRAAGSEAPAGAVVSAAGESADGKAFAAGKAPGAVVSAAGKSAGSEAFAAGKALSGTVAPAGDKPHANAEGMPQRLVRLFASAVFGVYEDPAAAEAAQVEITGGARRKACTNYI